MIKKPAGCEGCPLQTKGKGYCPDKISPKAKYVAIGEVPGNSDLAKGEPFSGKGGFVLDNWLIRSIPTLQLAKEAKQITYMNVLRCLPPESQGKAYPKGEEREQAEQHCRRYDNIGANADTFILFGEAAQRLYFKPELDSEDASDRRLGRDVKGVMGRIGREYTKDGKRYVFSPHPEVLLRQPAIVQHGQMALRIAANDTKAIEPDYIKWDVALEEMKNANNTQ